MTDFYFAVPAMISEKKRSLKIREAISPLRQPLYYGGPTWT
jgi:hypothetical protein